ncbi:MAG: universal stress protein [Aestuariivirga sp.]|nr:universal stress protein [Aestuariivirga sp.]
MQFPIFHGFIAPDAGSAKPLQAMKVAFGLAASLDAQLSVVIGALQISVRTILSSSTVKGLISDENKRSADSAEAAREQIAGLARNSGLIVHTEILKGDLGSIARRCANRARMHGLIFAEAGIPGELLGGALIEPLIFESGRPVIVVPNGFSSDISLEHVVVAWDGSAGAARAVWDSLPLLRLAKTIEIVTVTGEKDLNDVPAANALAGMLTYLGKKLNVNVLAFDGGTAASLIKQRAAQSGAGLIVQGAYGRSRWSELILGGVTREMLRDCTLPVLMSH